MSHSSFRSINQAQEDIKISDIRGMFPLEGEYIFRFKQKIGPTIVWLDVPENEKIPLYSGKIMMKATRLSWERKVWSLSNNLNSFQNQTRWNYPNYSETIWTGFDQAVF